MTSEHPDRANSAVRFRHATSSLGAPELGLEAFCRSASKHNLEAVELLLANKAEVNVKDKDGWTLLRAATSTGQTDMVKLLRQYGGYE